MGDSWLMLKIWRSVWGATPSRQGEMTQTWVSARPPIPSSGLHRKAGELLYMNHHGGTVHIFC